MTLIKYKPVNEFDQLSSQFEKFFTTTTHSSKKGTFIPKTDIYELEKSLVVELELPGFEKKDLKLTLENNVLTLTGERKADESNGAEYFRRERNFSSFRRSFNLPIEVNPNKVSANFENGILKVTLDKFEENNQKEKTIKLK